MSEQEPKDALSEPKKNMVKRICCKCGAFLGEVEGVGEVTHTYCDSCAQKVLDEIDGLEKSENNEK